MWNSQGAVRVTLRVETVAIAFTVHSTQNSFHCGYSTRTPCHAHGAGPGLHEGCCIELCDRSSGPALVVSVGPAVAMIANDGVSYELRRHRKILHWVITMPLERGLLSLRDTACCEAGTKSQL